MSEAERLDYLAGQVHALLAFACASIEAHPSPQILRQQFGRIEQIALSQVESRTVREAFLDGQLATNESLAVYFAKVA